MDPESVLIVWIEPLSLHARHTRAKARSTACFGPAAQSSSVWRLGMAPPLFRLQVSSNLLSSSTQLDHSLSVTLLCMSIQ